MGLYGTSRWKRGEGTRPLTSVFASSFARTKTQPRHFRRSSATSPRPPSGHFRLGKVTWVASGGRETCAPGAFFARGAGRLIVGSSEGRGGTGSLVN